MPRITVWTQLTSVFSLNQNDHFLFLRGRNWGQGQNWLCSHSTLQHRPLVWLVFEWPHRHRSTIGRAMEGGVKATGAIERLKQVLSSRTPSTVGFMASILL